MSTFVSDEDRRLIEARPADPQSTMAFNEIAACLVWADEVPEGLSAAGYEFVRDLLAARGFIHRAIPIEQWDFGETDRADRWNAALRAGLRWCGFERIALTKGQAQQLRAFLGSAAGE